MVSAKQVVTLGDVPWWQASLFFLLLKLEVTLHLNDDHFFMHMFLSARGIWCFELMLELSGPGLLGAPGLKSL